MVRIPEVKDYANAVLEEIKRHLTSRSELLLHVKGLRADLKRLDAPTHSLMKVSDLYKILKEHVCIDYGTCSYTVRFFYGQLLWTTV